MTVTSIPLSALPVPDETRRDQWGRYMVLPPGAGEPIGYSRATTVAGALDDGYGLPPWYAAMAVCGTVMRRGLFAQWEALIAEHGSPWYAGPGAKKECKRLVKECAAVGGANDRSEQGTALHRITELADKGRTLDHLSDETVADLAAYRSTLSGAGIQIVPDMIENMVVLDEHRVAGTFDRLVTVPGFELAMVADLKTGADLNFTWHSIATQIAIYANANDFYEQGPAPDGSLDVRTPMPEIDRDNGLIIWLPAGSGECELFLVDLRAGWESFSHSMWAREWRKRQVSMPLEGGGFKPAPDDLTQALEASLAAAPPEAPEAPVIVEYQAEPQPQPEPEPEPEPEPPASFTMQLRAWLQERIETIGKQPVVLDDLARSWPVDTAALASSDEHTPEQLAAIEKVLSAVERRHKVTFPQPRPEPESDEALVIHMFPGATNTTTETPT